KAKKVVGNYKRTKAGTGGRPPPPPPQDIFIKISDMLPSQFEHVPCSVDCDASLTGPKSQELISESEERPVSALSTPSAPS
uniref:Uncharacterized protein n=1 Tax=Romanomermis culicivorax TaxID=13658 RepID=A0A915JRG8_ROMCU